MIDLEVRTIQKDLNRACAEEYGNIRKPKMAEFPETFEAEVEAAYRESVEFKALYDYAKFEEQGREV